MDSNPEKQLRRQLLEDAIAARERSRILCQFAVEQQAFFRSQASLSGAERRAAIVDRMHHLALSEFLGK